MGSKKKNSPTVSYSRHGPQKTEHHQAQYPPKIQKKINLPEI